MSGSAAFSGRHYTLERDNRELQPHGQTFRIHKHYTLERDNRELQPTRQLKDKEVYYTLERDNMELQRKSDRN